MKRPERKAGQSPASGVEMFGNGAEGVEVTGEQE
jgi:hypothetical protein